MKNYNGFYLMGNYPDSDTFIEAAVQGLKHFDFLEVGIPFSDPIADGTAIADAAQKALENGVTFAGILDSLKKIRERVAPEKDIYLMTYANIIFNHEETLRSDSFKALNVKGLIVPDVPSSEDFFFTGENSLGELEIITFLTPETEDETIRKASERSNSFIYFISTRGITGGSMKLDADTMAKIDLAKSSSTCPVVLGFGIRDSVSAKTALEHCDGFIMGTVLIQTLNDKGLEGFKEFTDGLFGELGATD